MVDIREPRKIRQYGEGDSFEPTPPKAYEPPPEVKARYKKYKRFTLATFILLFLLLTQGVIFVTVRILMPQAFFMKTFPLLIEILLMLILFLLYRWEQSLSEPLSISNMVVLMVGEGVLAIAMCLMYHLSMSWLLSVIAVFSVVFAIYVLIFVKSCLKLRLGMCVIIALSFFVTDAVALNSLEFTPRYIYVSTGSYEDKTSDEINYYYGYNNEDEDPEIDEEEFNEIIQTSQTLSSLGWGVQRIDKIDFGNSLEFLNNVMSKEFRYGSLVNPDGRYDSKFFKKKSLYFAYVELENPDDTVEFTGCKYATLFSEPHITYTRNKPEKAVTDENTDDKARAVCIIVLEIPKAEEKNIIDKIVDFSMDKAVVEYR